MPHLETIDPQKFLKRSRSEHFQIILARDNEHFSWTNETFQSNIQLYNREELVKAYYKAAKKAMERNGHLQIIEIIQLTKKATKISEWFTSGLELLLTREPEILDFFPLSKKQKEILRLNVLHFMSFDEIARHFSLPASNVEELYRKSIGSIEKTILQMLKAHNEIKLTTQENERLQRENEVLRAIIIKLEPDKEKSEKQTEVYQLPVTELPIESRIIRALHYNNIILIGELVQCSKKKLLSMPYLGRERTKAIKEALQKQGLSLSAEED
jgi:hypothetical protein